MIIVKAIFRSSTHHFRLEVDGHAGQAAYGQDVVCSAASVLTYTVAQIIGAMAAMGESFVITPTIRTDSGKAEIEAICKSEKEYEEMLPYLVFVEAGYALLQHNYPEHLTFILDKT